MSRGPLLLLCLSAAIGALGLAAGGSAGALLAEQLTRSSASAGLPLGFLVVGSAAGAVVISRRTTRRGRAAGLRLGYALGAAGAVLVVVAATFSDFALLLAGSAALGAANAAIFLTRYAALDVTHDAPGRALGTVFFATALGAVASPNLLGPSGDLADALGLNRLTGLYVVAIGSFAAAAALLATLDHVPPPRLPSPSRQTLRRGLGRARMGLAVLATTNFVMVAVMAIAPVHLAAHDHGLDAIGVVISIHVLCMFGPSPLTGWLADRAGSAAVAALGGGLLAGAGACGALLDMSSDGNMTIMLVFLGLGWNAGVIGGSTMLASSVPVALRAHTEGIGEVAMGLAAGAGAPVAGVIAAVGGFAVLSLTAVAGGALVLATLQLARSQSPAVPVGARH